MMMYRALIVIYFRKLFILCQVKQKTEAEQWPLIKTGYSSIERNATDKTSELMNYFFYLYYAKWNKKLRQSNDL